MVIGILVFTNQIKERIIKKKDLFFEGKRYFGLNYIISEIDKEHEIKYISSREEELNSVDFVLVSLTSYYDILNLINELRNKKIKSTVIVGGAGLLNFSLISEYIDIAVLGRGEGIINDIFEGKEFDNVWYKEKDKGIENKYKVGEPKFLINYEEYKEQAVGCDAKCYFCQYSWRGKSLCKNGEYQSGYRVGEDYIQNINWNMRGASNYLVSGIDGITERIRFCVNKKITDNDIENKLLEFYNSERDYNALKLYCIVGFPFEKKIDLNDFNKIIKKVDKKSNKKLQLFIISTHFCPMPMTPMENESVNEYDFRSDIIKNKYRYLGDTIRYSWNGNQCTHKSTAMEECVLYRATKEDLPLVERIFLSSKYKGLKSNKKFEVMKQFFPERLWGTLPEENIILPYLQQPLGIQGAKKRYYANKKDILAA